MRLERLAEPDCYDSLYVSASGADAAVSCASRLVAEKGQGLKVLVLVVFGPLENRRAEEMAAAFARLGADYLLAEWPDARARRLEHSGLSSRSFDRFPEDESCLHELMGFLDAVRARVKPRQLYLPLGLGGDIDRCLCQEAGLHDLATRAGQSVFLYEERPQVFVPGAVRIRLAQLGARLPPAAADFGDRAGLLRFLLRLNASPPVWRGLRGPRERLAFGRRAAREWRRVRSWRPHKALGLRLQPVFYEGPVSDRRVGGDVAAAYPSLMPDLFGSPSRLSSLAADYARRLGRGPAVERYWLVLPPREDTGPVVAPRQTAPDPLREPAPSSEVIRSR